MSTGGDSLIDETGNTYGRLTVVERANREDQSGAYWLCKCECGNEHVVEGGGLRKGNTKSCGCLGPGAHNQEKPGRHEDDIIGDKFGRLTVKEYKGGSQWLCECECGNETSVYTGNLKSGNTKSCGCLHKEVVTKLGYESTE